MSNDEMNNEVNGMDMNRAMEIMKATITMCLTGNEEEMTTLGLSEASIDVANSYYWENKISGRI